MKFKDMNSRRAAWAAVLLASAIGAGWTDPLTAQGQQPSTGNTSIGPDALRDFNIAPQRRIVTQPRPTAPPPAATPTPPVSVPTIQPNSTTPQTTGSRPIPNPVAPTATPRATPQPGSRGPVTAAPPPQSRATTALKGEAAPLPSVPEPTGSTPPVVAPPEPSAPEPSVPDTPVAPSDGLPLWTYGLGIAALVLGGILFARRHRNTVLALPAPDDAVEEAHELAIPRPSPPRVPRPDPLPRPWIELDLLAERATADAQESVVEFALTIRNSGGSIARNLKLQAKLICGTLTQDEEIAAFQRKKPGEHRTISLPDLPAGEEITIQGRVDSKGEELKALRVEQKLLFIPLVVVNAHYDWNSSRTGQTSKSFLVGREKPDPAERMAPFRLDLGPRVYRTVGQRPYKIQRRV